MNSINKIFIIICATALSYNALSQSHSHKKNHTDKKQHMQHKSSSHTQHMDSKTEHKNLTNKLGSLIIEHAMTRETPPGTSVGAGYLTIINNGKDADTLISARSNFSKNVQIHEMAMNNNIMHMKQMKSGLLIPAGETVLLKPGGIHLMFMGLKQQLIEGNVISVTLHFEKAGAIDIKFPIKKAGGHKH